mmetsp:Transcript_6958/g.26288  ORF Transcript_6958/g.26288 Transcript_6958/m.26288 type:complete len:251 (-) Transcript_6958:967-1719(-)
MFSAAMSIDTSVVALAFSAFVSSCFFFSRASFSASSFSSFSNFFFSAAVSFLPPPFLPTPNGFFASSSSSDFSRIASRIICFFRRAMSAVNFWKAHCSISETPGGRHRVRRIDFFTTCGVCNTASPIASTLPSSKSPSSGGVPPPASPITTSPPPPPPVVAGSPARSPTAFVSGFKSFVSGFKSSLCRPPRVGRPVSGSSFLSAPSIFSSASFSSPSLPFQTPVSTFRGTSAAAGGSGAFVARTHAFSQK